EGSVERGRHALAGHVAHRHAQQVRALRARGVQPQLVEVVEIAPELAGRPELGRGLPSGAVGRLLGEQRGLDAARYTDLALQPFLIAALLLVPPPSRVVRAPEQRDLAAMIRVVLEGSLDHRPIADTRAERSVP